ncbi:MAG TPA: L,D-transpeptidase [Nocardioidaceae bacterium]|nr:L,D-transpeptidase [Nocardioidaceae bacterium]
MASRRATPAPVLRPRYPRIAAAVTSVTVTAIAVLGGAGVLPTSTGSASAYASPGGTVAQTAQLAAVAQPSLLRPVEPPTRAAQDDVLPTRTGDGKRVVFDMGVQRVWLVGEDGEVERTYPVSGSLTDNLDPGTYQVYSKSRDAVGIDDSGTMKFMVRFAHGERAAIGFHDIPVHDGELVQTRAELGSPQSHGCIRQLRKDARALWKFAPVGTTVVVVDTSTR